MTGRPVLELRLGDVVLLRRTHPCGGREWLVDRLGADIGIRCRTCGRRVLVERPALERRITGFLERGAGAGDGSRLEAGQPGRPQPGSR